VGRATRGAFSLIPLFRLSARREFFCAPAPRPPARGPPATRAPSSGEAEGDFWLIRRGEAPSLPGSLSRGVGRGARGTGRGACRGNSGPFENADGGGGFLIEN